MAPNLATEELAAIRARDADTKEGYFTSSRDGAIGRYAYSDRRWLLAYVVRLRDALTQCSQPAFNAGGMGELNSVTRINRIARGALE